MTKLARQIVLIIDNSASMNTREATLSRLESAKQRALKLVDNLRFFDEMMAISCHTQTNYPQPVHQPSEIPTRRDCVNSAHRCEDRFGARIVARLFRDADQHQP